jgi:hypothetical protein
MFAAATASSTSRNRLHRLQARIAACPHDAIFINPDDHWRKSATSRARSMSA